MMSTPPEQRGEGYATACVASLTKKLLSNRQQHLDENRLRAFGDALAIDFAT